MTMRVQDIRRKIECGDIKVVYARNSRREMLRPWVAKVLTALGHPEAFVTDESLISDFFARGETPAVIDLSKKLGVRVSARDYVVEIANRIRISTVSVSTNRAI